ncbi:ornithine carbamoyltransferase [Chloroflexota bacterium]
MKGKSLISVADLSAEEIFELIGNAIRLKKEGLSSVLSGKALALLFEKPSLRTKVSFDMAMYQLGGHTIYMGDKEVGLGKREPIADVARVLSRYVDVIAARTYSHETLKELAQYADVPVINALSEEEHPCQAMADLLTIYEKKGKLKGITLAYIGDGNNIANSLLSAAALVGMNMNIASPRGYSVDADIEYIARVVGENSGAHIFLTKEPQEAVSGADVVYTDVWASMGQEDEAQERKAVFAKYQVNKELLSFAATDAIIMHDLPAHSGEEVEVGILDSAQSVVFDQAENRLHAQKAILVKLLGDL